jgi:hypothetical protein
VYNAITFFFGFFRLKKHISAPAAGRARLYTASLRHSCAGLLRTQRVVVALSILKKAADIEVSTCLMLSFRRTKVKQPLFNAGNYG